MKQWLTRGGVVVLILFGVSTVVSMFATVTTHDAVYYLDHYEPRRLTGAKLGRMYQFAGGKLLGNHVCDLVFDPNQLDEPIVVDYRFANIAGELLPFIAQLNRYIMGADGDGDRIDAEDYFSLTWQVSETHLSPSMKPRVLESCESNVERLVKQGATVCAIASVITNRVPGGPPYAVRFKDECLSYCRFSEVETRSVPSRNCTEEARLVPTPTLDEVPFHTWAKVELGLISREAIPATPLIIGTSQPN